MTWCERWTSKPRNLMTGKPSWQIPQTCPSTIPSRIQNRPTSARKHPGRFSSANGRAFRQNEIRTARAVQSRERELKTPALNAVLQADEAAGWQVGKNYLVGSGVVSGVFVFSRRRVAGRGIGLERIGILCGVVTPRRQREDGMVRDTGFEPVTPTVSR